MKKSTFLGACVVLCALLGSFLQNLYAYQYEFAIISMFHNCAPYIKEWVEYHRLAGVDHFWLYDDASSDNWKEILQPYIESGLVEVLYWPAQKPIWTAEQNSAFRDGLKKALGVAKWVSLLDQDEFILPMMDKSIPECLEKRFPNQVAIYACWHHFGTSKITLDPGEPMLPRLVRCAHKLHSRNATGKSFLRPEYVKIDDLWTQHFVPLIDGFSYVNGDCEDTLEFRGFDLIPDGKIHSTFIRINHYAHRDEKYFKEVRLPREGYSSLAYEHYESFNMHKDFKILNYLKKYHPKEYGEYWLSYSKELE